MLIYDDLWPKESKIEVARSTARDFTVDILVINKLHFHVIDAK